MISLDAPQPPPFPSIWLFLPRVDSHWESMVVAPWPDLCSPVLGLYLHFTIFEILVNDYPLVY
jgi:hypothetical protein